MYIPSDYLLVVLASQVGKQRLIPAKIDENRDFNNARKKKEKERVTAMIDKLQDEQKKQQDHVNNVMARLREEKDSWFFSRLVQKLFIS